MVLQDEKRGSLVTLYEASGVDFYHAKCEKRCYDKINIITIMLHQIRRSKRPKNYPEKLPANELLHMPTGTLGIPLIPARVIQNE